MSGHPSAVDDPRAALVELYDVALPHVYGYLLARCGRRTLAEDLTAETFLAAVDAVSGDDPPTLTVPWIIGVARHKLAARLRARIQDALDLTGPAGPGGEAAQETVTGGTMPSTTLEPETTVTPSPITG